MSEDEKIAFLSEKVKELEKITEEKAKVVFFECIVDGVG